MKAMKYLLALFVRACRCAASVRPCTRSFVVCCVVCVVFYVWVSKGPTVASFEVVSQRH